MMIRGLRFNIYLVVGLAAALTWGCGCRSPEGQRKKVGSTFRVFVEVGKNDPRAGAPVPVYREHPVMIRVEKSPCVTEKHVKSAQVVEIVGGFALSVQLDKEGSWLFEQYTTSNKGRRFVVNCQWMTPPQMKFNTGRWLAAPKLTRAIADGVFTFTPDATRDEAELIAQGLNNLAKKAGTGRDDL